MFPADARRSCEVALSTEGDVLQEDTSSEGPPAQPPSVCRLPSRTATAHRRAPARRRRSATRAGALRRTESRWASVAEADAPRPFRLAPPTRPRPPAWQRRPGSCAPSRTQPSRTRRPSPKTRTLADEASIRSITIVGRPGSRFVVAYAQARRRRRRRRRQQEEPRTLGPLSAPSRCFSGRCMPRQIRGRRPPLTRRQQATTHGCVLPLPIPHRRRQSPRSQR
jgi:hypothetical protein